MLDTATLLFPIIRDVLYFIAGLFVFMIVMFNLPNVRGANMKEVIVFAVCFIILWCWAFSKLIML